MMIPQRISLDTNVFIFGIRGHIEPYPFIVLNNLFQFVVRISAQVEKELRQNITSSELQEFYSLIEPLSDFEICYQQPDQTTFEDYQKLGLKTGDSFIAAFCKDKKIDVLISENRHFLQKLPMQPFEVLDSESFCKKFGL